MTEEDINNFKNHIEKLRSFYTYKERNESHLKFKNEVWKLLDDLVYIIKREEESVECPHCKASNENQKTP